MQVSLVKIFWVFFKIGLFTFGGGYAMIGVIQKEVVENHRWIDEESVVKLIALSESTPGPFAINCTTYVGYQLRKFWGSFFATLGVVLPSIIIIMLISVFFESFLEIKVITYAFKGIQAGVAVLIFDAFFKLSKNVQKNGLSLFLTALAFICSWIFSINIIYIIIIAAFIGIVYYSIREGKNHESAV